jgi:hypothetical protein
VGISGLGVARESVLNLGLEGCEGRGYNRGAIYVVILQHYWEFIHL